MLPEQGEYAYVSTLEALTQAGIDQDYLDKNEVGILYGTDSSAEAVIDATDIVRERKNTMMMGSGAVFQTMNSTVGNTVTGVALYNLPIMNRDLITFF